MALLTGMTAAGVEVPVQVYADGRLVAQGMEGAAGAPGSPAVIGGTATMPGLTPPGDSDTGLYSPGPNAVALSVGAKSVFSVDVNGLSIGSIGSDFRVDLHGSLSIAPGTVSKPGFSFAGDSAAGLYSPFAGSLGFVTDGINRLTIGNYGLGVGVSPTASSRFTLSSALTGYIYQNGFLVDSTVRKDVTGRATYFRTEAQTEAEPFQITNVYHYTANQKTFGAGSVVANQVGFSASASLVGGVNNFGFHSTIPYQANCWAFRASGLADSYFASTNFIFANGGTERARIDSAGRLLMGKSIAVTGSKAQIQLSATANIATSIYADNTAAKAAGLVAGDLYRKADGTAMLAF